MMTFNFQHVTIKMTGKGTCKTTLTVHVNVELTFVVLEEETYRCK